MLFKVPARRIEPVFVLRSGGFADNNSIASAETTICAVLLITGRCMTASFNVSMVYFDAVVPTWKRIAQWYGRGPATALPRCVDASSRCKLELVS
jgi:hypothetical protein